MALLGSLYASIWETSNGINPMAGYPGLESGEKHPSSVETVVRVKVGPKIS
jgi:hypothetical protein